MKRNLQDLEPDTRQKIKVLANRVELIAYTLLSGDLEKAEEEFIDAAEHLKLIKNEVL